MPTVEQQLETGSAAYRAYSKLVLLPESTPRFIVNPKGYPLIHEGEKFCSNKFDREHIFTMHVESCRGDVAQHRPMSKYREHLEMELNPNELALADRFYSEIMKNEQYPGKLKRAHDHINQDQASRSADGAELLRLQAALVEVQKKGNAKQKELLELQSEEVKIKQKMSKLSY